MSKRNLPKHRLALGLMLALAAVAPAAIAQNTTSNIAGRVSDASQQAIPGAEVTITHLPSGSVNQAVTDSSGRYAARGLRTGGPYRITIVKDGRTETIDDVYLQLAQTETVDANLGAGGDTLETIEVTGSAAPSVFSADSMGAGTNVGSQQLAALPSIQRSIQDYARLDPRISQTDKGNGAISAAGQNNRFNQIAIDGVTVNDTFGLQANNLPLLRQPVSMEAIEELDIAISSYDVTQRGYTGAGINAVTKSGTNDFKGSVYYINRDGEWGREVDERGVSFLPFEQQETYGVTLGGPIVKDKLFFFAGYEKFERSSPAPDIGSLRGVTTAQAQQVIDIARSVYGIDAGNFNAAALSNEVEEYLIKFDWNLNDNHRANFRYTKTEQNQVDLARFGGTRLALSSSWFNRLNSFESYVGQWFADWNQDFSTEFKVSYREFLAEPQPLSRLPQFQVSTGGGQIALGTEQFRHANLLRTETWNTFFAATYYAGDHQLRGGFDYENNDIYNLFVESNFGAYNFNSIADFAAGRYSSYQLRVPSDGNLDSAAAVWELNSLGLFLQDTWSVNSNLTLDLGLRMDIADVPDAPTFNPTASTRFGRRNDRTIDGETLLQPRFGFNYTFDSERPMQLRGGIGLFQGASANVWLSNPYTNNGRTISVYGCGGALLACTGTLPPQP
jgi:Carboxypeptidase regulatory-like domain/TonB dependent receptor